MQTNRLGSLTLVTSPSIVENTDETFCLINFSKQDQDKFADFINRYKPKENITIYIVDSKQDKSLSYEWLTDAIEKSHTVIISSKNKFKIFKTDSRQNLEGIFNE
tara:strand:- start:1237 stop:1551 length:315 start_codon:yes stop_codon:yes gene_type:complete